MACWKRRSSVETALDLLQQVTNSRLLAIAAIVAFLCGCWWNAQASRKAKEPFAPAISSADYCAIFLWILAVILGGVAIRFTIARCHCCGKFSDCADQPEDKRSRNRAALVKITREGPQLLPAKFYAEQTKPDRLVIGFDD